MLIAELGNISVVEVGKELGRRWSRLDMAFKEKYDIAHIEAKSRYLDEMKNYKPSLQFLEKKAKQDKKLNEKVGGDGEEGKYFSFLQKNWRMVV